MKLQKKYQVLYYMIINKYDIYISFMGSDLQQNELFFRRFNKNKNTVIFYINAQSNPPPPLPKISI